MTIQQVGKALNAGGLKKASTKRVNFQTIFTGHYDARHLKIYGLNTMIVSPRNGTTPAQIQAVLADAGIQTEEKNGIVIVKNNEVAL